MHSGGLGTFRDQDICRCCRCLIVFCSQSCQFRDIMSKYTCITVTSLHRPFQHHAMTVLWVLPVFAPRDQCFSTFYANGIKMLHSQALVMTALREKYVCQQTCHFFKYNKRDHVTTLRKVTCWVNWLLSDKRWVSANHGKYESYSKIKDTTQVGREGISPLWRWPTVQASLPAISVCFCN